MANSARQPSVAPRDRRRRGGIPIGLATAAVVVVLAVAIGARSWTPQTGGTASASGSGELATPTEMDTTMAVPSATATATNLATLAATPQTTPAATSILSGTPRPGDEAAATAFVSNYETLLTQQDFTAAWSMLSPEERAIQGTYDSWVAGTELAQKYAGTSFSVGPASHDWQSWWEPGPNWLPQHYPGDYSRAYIFAISDGSSAQNGGGELLVLPSLSGHWEICILR